MRHVKLMKSMCGHINEILAYKFAASHNSFANKMMINVF